jgi:uncharacterized membrane protein YeaQ/YmgE (transglycosylase-associated protein family)
MVRAMLILAILIIGMAAGWVAQLVLGRGTSGVPSGGSPARR